MIVEKVHIGDTWVGLFAGPIGINRRDSVRGLGLASNFVSGFWPLIPSRSFLERLRL